MAIYERLRKIVVEQLGAKDEEVVPRAHFVDDLGADSLDLVELVMAIEGEFSTPSLKIEIPDEDAVDYLKGLGVEGQEQWLRASRLYSTFHFTIE